MRIKKMVESLGVAKSRTGVDEIERELAKLEQRRAQLAESLDAATHIAINASMARRELIIANRDQSAVEEASGKVREAEEQRIALDDALRSLDDKIRETTKQLDKAKAEAERHRIAQALEQGADAVEKAISAIEKLAKTFGAAFQQLEATLTPVSSMTAPAQGLNHSQIAGLLTAEALAANAPGLFVEEYGASGIGSVLRRAFPIGEGMVKHAARDKGELEKSVGARKLAESIVTRPLRAKAAAIRSGNEPAVFPAAILVSGREPPPPERHVLFLKPVSYLGKEGRRIIHEAWTARVPEIVGDVAIERGLALDADTDEGREKLKEMMEFRQRPWQGVSAPLTVDDTIDLGLNLAEELERTETAA